MQEAKHYREGIKSLLKQVPPGVLSGSYQRSVSYKEAVDRAHQALKTPNSTAKLSEAYKQLAAFYTEAKGI